MSYFGGRGQETTTTTGTGNVTLAGAVTGRQAISAIVQVGDPFPYTIEDANGTGWEDGVGTLLTSTTFSRDTINESSNSGSAITLSSGTHKVMVSINADDMNKRPVFGDASIDYVASGLLTPTTSGTLTGSISLGVAYVVGQRVVKGAQSHLYTASKDTYVDLSNMGVLTYVPVTNGAGAPSITANSIRLGKVVTGSSTITGGADLRNLLAKPAASVVTTTTQSLPHGTETPIAFPDGEVVNNNGMHSTSSNNSRFTCVIPGLYVVTCFYAINAVTTTTGSGSVLVDAILKVNNTTTYDHQQFLAVPVGNSAFMSLKGQIKMGVGDYVEMRHTHFDSAGTGAVQTVNTAAFSIVRAA